MKSTDTLPTTPKTTIKMAAFIYAFCFAIVGTFLIFCDPFEGHID